MRKKEALAILIDEEGSRFQIDISANLLYISRYNIIDCDISPTPFLCVWFYYSNFVKISANKSRTE